MLGLLAVALWLVIAETHRRANITTLVRTIPRYFSEEDRAQCSKRIRSTLNMPIPYGILSIGVETSWATIIGHLEKALDGIRTPEVIVSIHTGGVFVGHIIQNIIESRCGHKIPHHTLRLKHDKTAKTPDIITAGEIVRFHDIGHTKQTTSACLDRGVMLVDDSIYSAGTIKIALAILKSVTTIVVYSKTPFLHSTVGGLPVVVANPLRITPFDRKSDAAP